jgi:hypothetical protein
MLLIFVNQIAASIVLEYKTLKRRNVNITSDEGIDYFNHCRFYSWGYRDGDTFSINMESRFVSSLWHISNGRKRIENQSTGQ